MGFVLGRRMRACGGLLMLLACVLAGEIVVEDCGTMQCKEECRFGYKKNADGCPICECDSAPTIFTECAKESCWFDCKYGYKLDENGCNTCTCNVINDANEDLCKSLDCPLVCWAGLDFDDRGCKICKCMPSRTPDLCKEIACPEDCEGRFRVHSSNCIICECDSRGSAELCEPAACELDCYYGLAKNAFGCPICQCAQRPPYLFCSSAAQNGCPYNCAYGYEVDEKKACVTCDCKLPTVAHFPIECGNKPTCPDNCEHGFEVEYDVDRCIVCKCRQKVVTCDAPACYHDCEKGYVFEDGCRTCTCVQPDSCLIFECSLSCMHGYELDELNCQLCKCAETVHGLTPIICDSTTCPDGEKCTYQRVECAEQPCPVKVLCLKGTLGFESTTSTTVTPKSTTAINSKETCESDTCPEGETCTYQEDECTGPHCLSKIVCVPNKTGSTTTIASVSTVPTVPTLRTIPTVPTISTTHTIPTVPTNPTVSTFPTVPVAVNTLEKVEEVETVITKCAKMTCPANTECKAKKVMCVTEPCPVSVRCAPIQVSGCPPVTCTMECPKGFQVDENDCVICECISNCPVQTSCRLLCGNGNMLDADGCELCKCQSPFDDDLCQAVKYDPDCYKRYLAVDESNCIIERCADPSENSCNTKSLRSTCKLNCSNGYATDNNGCFECACAKSLPEVFCDDARQTCAFDCQYGYEIDELNACIRCKCKPPRLVSDYKFCWDIQPCPTNCKDGRVINIVDFCPQCECVERTLSQCEIPDCYDVHSKACVYGVRLDAFGCPTCECVQGSHCAEFQCDITCHRGYLTDAMVCNLCACSDVQERELNACEAMACPDGNACVYEELGPPCVVGPCKFVPNISCVPQPRLSTDCPEPECTNNCPHGFRKDHTGCTICECVQRSDPCQSHACSRDEKCILLIGELKPTCIVFNPNCAIPMCANDCPHGYQRDKDGCETCDCAEPSDPCQGHSCPGGEECVLVMDESQPACVASKETDALKSTTMLFIMRHDSVLAIEDLESFKERLVAYLYDTFNLTNVERIEVRIISDDMVEIEFTVLAGDMESEHLADQILNGIFRCEFDGDLFTPIGETLDLKHFFEPVKPLPTKLFPNKPLSRSRPVSAHPPSRLLGIMTGWPSGSILLGFGAIVILACLCAYGLYTYFQQKGRRRRRSMAAKRRDPCVRHCQYTIECSS